MSDPVSDFRKEYAAYCREHGTPDRLELMLCDLNAILRGKWLPGGRADKLADGAVRLPLSTYAPNIMGSEPPETGLGIAVGDPDGTLLPVPGSLRPVPWAEGHVAQLQVEMAEDGRKISALSSRELLRSVLERFRRRGLTPVIATELEFYVVKPRRAPREAPTPPERLPDAQNYDLEVLSRFAPMLAEIRAAAQSQGLVTDTLTAEFGPGQFEINFHHTDDALEAADTALLFRRLVRGVVARHGYEATFMAKPYAREPGNGMHVHVSLRDSSGANVFDGGDAPSETLLHAVAGVLDSMVELQAIFAPHMNSYRRFQVNSFAPSQVNWGHDNRAAAVRLPEVSGPAARLEHRICGADVNPYLAVAAILGGVLHGLENRLSPPPAVEEGAPEKAPRLTHDWSCAVERLADSTLAENLFGKRYRDLYVAVRRDEIATLTAEISATEYEYYLGRL